MSAANDSVTSPDQRKPGNRSLAYVGAVVTAALLPLLLLGDHANSSETHCR